MNDEKEAPEETEAATALQEMREQLTKAEIIRDEALRQLAEMDNARKRNMRDLELERKYAHAKLAGDLLPALDNLDRAIAAAKQAGESGGLFMGVMATHLQMMDVLKRHGINRIDSMGQPFDPNMHEAVKMEQSADVPANHVLTVLQQGFMVHDRILRPASVVVAQEPTTPVEYPGESHANV
jgi:molecular chaperone GrpE